MANSKKVESSTNNNSTNTDSNHLHNSSPTPSSSSDLDEDRISPLPVFNNPAYESSSDDLENETASSTVSAEHRNNSISKNSPSPTVARKNSSKDPVEELRNLAREISPGITLSRADADQLLKSAAAAVAVSNKGNNMAHTNEAYTNTEFDDAGNNKKNSSSRRNSETTNTKHNNNNDLVLKINAKSLSARNSKPAPATAANNNKDSGGHYFNNSCESNDLDADLKKLSKAYKQKLKASGGSAFDPTSAVEDKSSGGSSGSGRLIFGFTLKQCSLFFLFAFANILSGICISLQAPFYPEVAIKEKGASNTENGIVFSCFELTVFIMAPFFGKNMSRIGPKLVFNTGIVLTAVCSSFFGFLIYVDNRYIFIGLSIIIRIFEAVGAAAHVTASFTLIAVVFPDNVSTVFAVMETCTGIGLIVGPVVGGALHDLGGFTLPFVSIGGLLFICVIFSYLILLKQNTELKKDDENEKKYGYKDILKIPVVALSGLSILTAAISIGYNAPVLDGHISKFNLTKVETGLVFIINGGTYAITAPLWGRLCDKLKFPRFLTLLGATFILIGFLFIGPIFFMPFDTILWVTCVGLFIQGLGLGANFVSGFALALHDSIHAGLPDGIGTYGLVSGLWMSAFSLGNFIGPFASGILEDSVGYRTGSVSVIGVQLVIIILALAFIIRGNRDPSKSKHNKDSELEIHAESGIAVREAKFFTGGFDEKF